MSGFIPRKRPRDFCDSDDESEDSSVCSLPEPSYSVSTYQRLVNGNLLRPVGSESDSDSDSDLKGGKIAGNSRTFQEPRLKASEIIRPWRRLYKIRKTSDSSSWYSDIKHRDGTSKGVKVREELKTGATIHPSPRNKKQHLRELTIANTDAEATCSTLLSKNCYMKRSFSLSSTSSQQQDEGPVYSEEEDLDLQEEDTPHPFDSVHRFRPDEGVGITKHETRTAEIHEFLFERTKQLKAEVNTLTSEVKRQNVLIRKLLQQSDTNARKPLTGCVGGLKWCLMYNADGQPEVLGNGSYGKVYKAFCASTNQPRFLAAKVVLDLTPKSAEVLKKEVKQLTALSPHERIVTYFGTCYAKHPRFNENCLFVFTEFMPGGSLSSYLEKNGPLNIKQMWHYTKQILEGVKYLHSHKIIHRDIKGSNILCDLKGNVKLADFGSAKQICSESLSRDKTSVRYPYGTAPWAAPELLCGQNAKLESDIWSIGATVVEMLTGEMPYKNENFDNRWAIVYQVGNHIIDPLMSMKKGSRVNLGVEYFLHKCFKSDAEDRSSAAVLMKILAVVKDKVS